MKIPKGKWAGYLAVYVGIGVGYALYYASRAQTTTVINGVPVTSAIGENISASLWARLVLFWPLYLASDIYDRVSKQIPPVTGGNSQEDDI